MAEWALLMKKSKSSDCNNLHQQQSQRATKNNKHHFEMENAIIL